MPGAIQKAAKKEVTKSTAKAAVKASTKAAAKTVAKPAKAAVKASAKGAMPAEGAKAPAFALPDDAGRTVRLSDFAGKSLVVYFYPKDSTPGCTQESCDFRDNLNRMKSSGAAVVGVSADSVESHRRFKEKQGLNFPLLSDPGHEALEAYGVWQEKSLYGRKFMGIVRSTFVIDAKGVVRKVFSPVKVTGHVDAVLAALKD